MGTPTCQAWRSHLCCAGISIPRSVPLDDHEAGKACWDHPSAIRQLRNNKTVCSKAIPRRPGARLSPRHLTGILMIEKQANLLKLILNCHVTFSVLGNNASRKGGS